MKTIGQTNSSCSNPYIMNLSNGAGNAEFQFHYPDTVMYICITNLTNREQLIFSQDSSKLKFNRIKLFNKNCNNLIIYENIVPVVVQNNYGLNLNLISDSAMLIIYHNNYSISDTTSFKITLSTLQPLGNPICTDAPICENLVWNGDFEQYSPPYPYYWPFVQFNQFVCGWSEQSFMQYTGIPLETSPDYYNAYFDQISNCPTQLCESRGLTNLSSLCGFPPQVGNDFFSSNNRGYIGQFYANPPEVLQGTLQQPLQINKKYYIEINYANGWSNPYAGNVQFDVSASPNYIISNYLSVTPEPIAISSMGVDYNPNGWSKQNTVITAIGNEQFIYLGNLTQQIIQPVTSNNTLPPFSNCVIGNVGLPYYAADNIVVKEFFADAGASTVIACFDESVQLGGSSCPFPNATYSWTPANYFDDPASSNPMFTAPSGSPSNITVTLTVSITVNNGVLGNAVVESTSSTVNISVIQGSSITLSGTTSVSPGGTTTLFANGGSNYVWTGSDGTSGTGSSINVGPLTQDVTYTVDAISDAGCKVTKLITVVVTTLPQACVNDPNYSNTIPIPNGANESTLIGMNLGSYNQGVYVITSKNFLLTGTLDLSNSSYLEFVNCHFYCFDASEIINNGILNIFRSKFEACNNMWKGITNNNAIYVKSGYFKDAEYAIHLKNNSKYEITYSTFDNNLFGIMMGEPNMVSLISGFDYSNQYSNSTILNPPYLGMLNWKPRSESGIKVEALKNVLQIGVENTNMNKFYKINNGIYIVNSNVKVVNSIFNSITLLNQSALPLFLNYNGCAIYAQQNTLSTKKLIVNPIAGYTGPEFEDCNEGIKTNRVSLSAVGLNMNNIYYGIQCFNSTMCIHNVSENTINAILKGIEISGASFANSININSNKIKIINSIAMSGISVTATQLGIAKNVNIKFNEVTAGRTTINGIHASKLASPTLLCNTVKRFNNSSQYSQWITLTGYNISGCNAANLTTNQMEWLNPTSTANNGNDYVVTASPESELICNNSGVSNVGFKISSNCIDLTFRRNKIGSHAIGLYYDGTANSGSQPANASLATEGNKWIGSYSLWGAQNYNTDFLSVQNSTYYYNPANTNINRPPNSSWSPSYWFNGNGSTFIQPDCTSGACILIQIAKPGNNEYFKAIADGSITTIDYPAQSKWMAQSYLINRLGKDSTLRNSDDSLHYFYYSPESRTLRTIKEIDAKNNNFAETSKLISQSVYANDSLLNLMAQNMTVQLSDTLMPDSVFYSLSANLQAQYALVNDINEGFSNDIFELMSQNLSQAKEINDTLQSTNANETILQTINDIYYRFHQSNYLKINEDDSVMIAYIAHLCPLAAGPAVFQARDLYTLLADSVIYNDSVKCAMQGYVREELQVFEPKALIQKIAPTYFKAFPVPSKNAVELQFTELNSEAKLTVFNIQGQLIYQTTIPKGLSKFNLDIEPYSEGVYQVLLVNNELSKRSKICKIK